MRPSNNAGDEHHETTNNMGDEEISSVDDDDDGEVDVDDPIEALRAITRHSLYLVQFFNALLSIATQLEDRPREPNISARMVAAAVYSAWETIHKVYNTA